MNNYSANDLCFLSTVIARSATSRAWETGLDNTNEGTALQEVQCMQLNGELYLAGNHAEHKLVDAYLKAFGVCDEATFIDCIRYSDWLLAFPYKDRKKEIGEAYKCKYSEQEEKTLGMATRTHFPALSAEEEAAAKELAKGTSTAKPALAWFLRKFIGAGTKAGVVKSTAAKVGSVKNELYKGGQDINLVCDEKDVHAELKLLGFLGHCLVQRQLFLANATVRVGGLKKTCTFCAGWIEWFSKWMHAQFKVDVALPANDDRAQGKGAGKRPSSNYVGEYGTLVAKLFNGENNTSCAELAADWQ
jgi:hypothetical protein